MIALIAPGVLSVPIVTIALTARVHMKATFVLTSMGVLSVSIVRIWIIVSTVSIVSTALRVLVVSIVLIVPTVSRVLIVRIVTVVLSVLTVLIVRNVADVRIALVVGV